MDDSGRRQAASNRSDEHSTTRQPARRDGFGSSERSTAQHAWGPARRADESDFHRNAITRTYK